MIKFNKNLLLMVFILICGFGLISSVKAATTINLGTANGYAILGASTITNTGSTTINGDLGLFPGTSVTGFPPGLVNGLQEITTAAASGALVDLLSAYVVALSQPITSTIPTQLGATTVVGGVYDSTAGTFDITGTLTLDGQNNTNTVFIFKADTTLITAGTSSVVLINGAQACNVFWLVGSSATLGANSTLKGTIIASSSITLTTGANLEGRALALGAAVTLDTNVITKPTCAVAVIGSNSSGSSFGSGPSGSNFGSSSVIPWWALATTTTVTVPTVNYSTTTTVVPRFPNTGFESGGLLLISVIILIIIASVSIYLLFLKNIKR